MLDFTDQPYRFFPPKPNRLVIGLAKLLNHRFVLPGPKHRIKRVQLRNAERILQLCQGPPERCLFLPNHSTHSDPHLMLDVQRRLRINCQTMAAYDVFLRGWWQAWFMQSIGCFSIDREGSDSQAMKTAIDLLLNGRPLTIYPEGNVHLMNDRLTPFLGGAAFIAMRAQKKLGVDKPIYAIPVSLKLSHLTDCRHELIAKITQLETEVGLESSDDVSVRVRLRQIGVELLTKNLRQRGYMAPSSGDEDLDALLEASALQIISKLEQKIDLPSEDSDDPLERVRRIRSAIHQIRIDEQQHLDHRVAATWADEAILAVRILSYAGDYLSERTSLDRCSETVEKLREDLHGKMMRPLGDRMAWVHFGDPINLADQLVSMKKDSRAALSALTGRFEDAVQLGLDDINRQNDLPGAQLLESQ